MKVNELIKMLKDMPQDLDVIIHSVTDNGDDLFTAAGKVTHEVAFGINHVQISE